MVLETGIFLSQAIWWWRVRYVRREAKKAGMTYDEYVAEHPSKKFPKSESQETMADVEAGSSDSDSNKNNEKTETCGKDKTNTQVESDTTEGGVLQSPPPAVTKSG